MARDEEQFHRSLVQHLRLRADKRVVWFHVPNGEYRSKATGGRLKAMGVLAGVPDLTFILPDASVCFLELKRKGGVTSPAQHDFARRCDAICVELAVVYDIDQALSILTAWGVIPLN